MQATLTLDANENLLEHILRASVQYVIDDSAEIWNVFLLISPETANANFDMLFRSGFQIAGTLSADAKTTLKLRKSLRRSSDGGSRLTVALPMLAPSDEERKAVELMKKRMTGRQV